MSTTEAVAFGAKVEEYRERLDMLQKELAEQAELSRSHLNRIEKGTRKPPHVEAVLRMIVALRLTQIEAEELVEPAGLSPLVLQKINFGEDALACGLVKIAKREAPSGVQPAIGKPTQKVSSLSVAYDSPLSIDDGEILIHRLAALKKKLEAAEKNMRDANEEFAELRALVEELFTKEEE